MLLLTWKMLDWFHFHSNLNIKSQNNNIVFSNFIQAHIEIRVFMAPSASTTDAETLIDTLDRAGDYLEIALKANKDDKDIAALKKALAELETTRSLLSMIDSEDKFQTPRVISELPVVAKSLNTLVTELNKGNPPSMRRVNNAIDGLKGKTKNLQSLLPGLYVEATDNRQGPNNKFMINAPVVKKLESGQLRGATFRASGNVADGEVQINSLVETDMDFKKKPSK